MARVAIAKKKGAGSGNAQTIIEFSTGEDATPITGATNIKRWKVTFSYPKAAVAALALEDASAYTALRAITFGNCFDETTGYSKIP